MKLWTAQQLRSYCRDPAIWSLHLHQPRRAIERVNAGTKHVINDIQTVSDAWPDWAHKIVKYIMANHRQADTKLETT
jgi:hypothetical protein